MRKALEAELFELRVDLNYVLVRLSRTYVLDVHDTIERFSQNYPRLEKYISLFPPDARQTEDAAAPIHSVSSPSATGDKRETLRERVRGQMRAGEMAGEPETLERKHLARQSLSEPWQSAISKETKNVGTKGKEEAKQDLDAFFEGEDSGANEGTAAEGAEEWANVLSVPAEVPARRRRRDKSTTRLDKHSETAERHSKKAKHKKHRGQATTPPPIIQDGFFGDDESE